MSLPPRTASWEDDIATVAREFQTATINITFGSTPNPPYDPNTGTGGGSTPTLLWSGLARIQQVGSIAQQSTEYQWAVGRPYRFQVDYAALGGIDIPKGAKIQVVDGGRDAILTHRSFTVETATNSTQRAVRTIEAITDGTPQ